VRFDLAKERKGGGAAGRLHVGRGRGESSGVESVEGDVWADVVERGGDDCLELGHVERVAVSGRHVEGRGYPSLVVLLFKYETSHSISTPFWRSSYPLIGDLPPSPSQYFIYPFMSSSLSQARSLSLLWILFLANYFVPYARNPSHDILPKAAICLHSKLYSNSSHR